MDYDYIAGEIEAIFNPEPDEDGQRNGGRPEPYRIPAGEF